MKARVESARSTLNQHVRLSIALLGLALAVLIMFVPGSHANLPLPNTFEGDDGNLIVDTSGNTDWANISPVISDDVASGTNDNSFGQGTKEDDPAVTIVTGSIPPNKNDLTRSYLATASAGGNTYLYLAWERAVNTGSANLDFELDQNATTGWDATTTGNVTINRAEGDLLITYDFGGSGTPDIGLLKWLTPGNGHANSDCFASGQTLPCWGSRTDLTSTGFAVAAVSTGNVLDPLLGPSPGTTLGAGLFGEAAINLSAVPGVFTQNTCTSYGSEFVKSRSSGSSIDAELKDFIAPGPIHVSNCGSITIHKDVPGTDPQAFTFSGSGTDSSVTGFTLKDDGTVGDNTKAFPAVQPGTYSFDETNIPAGWKLDNPAVTCTSSGTGTSAPASQTTSGLSVTLGASGTVDCTYHDTPKTGTIEVKKVVSPSTNGGTFDLTIGSTTFDNSGAGYGNGGTTGAQSEKVGNYAVSEAAHTGTDGSRYTSAYSCTRNGQALTSGSGTSVTNGVTLVNDGDAVVCTFTNTFAKINSGVSTTVKDGQGATVTNVNAAALGTVVHDTATLSGGVAGFPFGDGTANAPDGGTVVYSFFPTNDCSGPATTTQTVNVGSNGSVPNADPTSPLGAGSYSYQAVYSGNQYYNGKTGDCEPFKVNQATLSLGTTIHDANHVTVSAPVALGSVLHDTGQLTGLVAGFGAPGAVSFSFYTDGSCTPAKGSPIATSNTLDNGDQRSVDTGALGAGSYSFQASIAGNANYVGATSPCEPFSVNQATPTLVTTVKNGQGATVDNANPAALGTVVHDTSVLGASVGSFPLGDGTATPPVGATVKYEFFTTNDCSGSHTDQVVNVAANGTVPDASTKTLGAGSYSYLAVYSGNANYTSQTAACEPFTVSKPTPTLVTTVKNGQGGTVDNAHPAALGTAVHDTATLGGSVGTFPLGGVSDPAHVTYEFFTTNDCSGTHTDQTVDVAADGSVPDANPQTLGSGSYSYLAVYSGNSNYATKTAACEPFAVGNITPTLVTTVKDGQGGTVTNGSPAALGTAVHDTSVLGGSVGNFPLGGVSDPATVTYQFFTTNDCTGTHTDQVVNVAANGSVPDADPQTLGAGSYSYLAVYSGNSNYSAKTADCEPFKVNQATPTLVTTVRDGQGGTVTNGSPAALGTAVRDTATLGGSVGSFALGDGTANGGTVKYEFFTTNDCSGSHTDQVVNVAANGSVPDADPQTLGAGSYSYLAIYSGNSNYSAKTADCEPFKVSQAQLTMTTHVHDANHTDVTNQSVGLGSTVHDLSVVTGAVTGFGPTGAVTFVLYNSSSCAGSGTIVAADGNESGNVRSADVMSLVPGQYGFIATVAGDTNYLGQSGACEPFSVAQAGTTTVTAVHDADHNVVTTVSLGSTVHDSATVTSTNSSANPTGNVNFTFFTNSDCTGNGSSAGSHAVSSGVADGSSPQGPLAAGSYGFRASYVGDTNFIGSTGVCEPFTVSKADTTTATVVHDAQHNVVTSVVYGDSVHDSATVTSSNTSFKPTGSVSFQLFSGSTCTGEGSPEGTVALDSNGVAHPSNTVNVPVAGSYSFRASYSGDANFNESLGACEPFTVAKKTPTIATSLSASEVVIGTSVHDSATLAGASPNAGGSVTYSVFDNNTCTPNANTRDGGTVAVTNGKVPDSNALLFNTAGDFYWQAAYSGDSNNAAATSPCTSEHLVVDRPAIAITKNPATQAVNSGGTATFTITVTNTGTVTLTNVTVTDPLSTNCVRTVGTLTPGQSTSYTCTKDSVFDPFTNVATATGHPPVGPDVTASASANVTIIPPPPSSPPATPAPQITDLAIVKTVDNASVLKGSNVTYTLTVTNNGPTTDTNVQVADSLPAGVTYVSSTSSQGSCSGTAVVQCNLGTMTVGQKVTITIVVNTVNTGTIVNTTTVVGALPESTLTNNTSSVSITVTAPPAPKPAPKPFKPPVVKPKPKPVPPPCYAVVVAPKSLTVGKNAKLQFHVTAKNKGISGVKVEVKGAGVLKLSGRTNSAGKVTLLLHPKKPGIVLVKPASYKGCTNPRIGVIGAFTPPVTG